MNIFEIEAKTLFIFRDSLHMKTTNSYPHNAVNFETGDVVTVPMRADLKVLDSTLTLTPKTGV